MVWEVSGNVALPTVGQVYSAQASSTGSPTSSGTGSRSSGTGTGTAASSHQTGGSSSKQIAGMSVGLVTVMLGFVWWL
jgi:hypothetical protein